MATIKREKLGRRGFTDLQREQLFSGHDYLGDAYGGCGWPWPFDEEAAAHDWTEHRDELMTEWFAAFDKGRQHGFGNPKPNSLRPWGWWAFEAPEARSPDESEHDFLERHGLLLPGDEGRRDRLEEQERRESCL